jgi:hypothetical protein
MNSVDRLAVVCKVLLDSRVLELRRENEALKLRLFWKEHGPEQLKAAMRMANGAAGGPGCGCLGCKVSGRGELEFSNVAGKQGEGCAFKAWFEQTLIELDMDVAVSLPAAAVWVHVKEVDSRNDLLDDGVHFTNLGADDWVAWTYGSRLWKAASVSDPELGKLQRLFLTLDAVGGGA